MNHLPPTLARSLVRSLGMVLVLLGVTLSKSQAAGVHLFNVKSGETVRYPVVLLHGEIETEDKVRLRLASLTDEERSNGVDFGSVTVTNLSSPRTSRIFKASLFKNQFKALMELVPGQNRLQIHTDSGDASLVVNYSPMTTPLAVRVIYLTDSTGNTSYPTQFASDPQDYRAKLDTAAKLFQTFMAESLRGQGYGRRTFPLEFDAQGKVKVYTIRAPRPASYYRQRDPDILWSDVYQIIERQFPNSQTKNIVVMGFAGYNSQTQQPQAHASLGAANLGVVSNLGLFSWPSTLQDVPKVFSDSTVLDTRMIFDQSANRGTIWGLAATTMGTTLHELGHTFGLLHSEDPRSIMSRGFDQFHRTFTFDDAPSRRNLLSIEFSAGDVAYFEPAMSVKLCANPWFRNEGKGIYCGKRTPMARNGRRPVG